MDSEKNKIIQSLYLCTTNSRERMQQSLLENILYSIGEPLTSTELLDLIKSEFHFEVDKFEFTELITQLVVDRILIKTNSKYDLTDESKKGILSNVLENEDIENSRKKNIKKLLNEIDPDLSEDGVKNIADAFNDYVYECFLEYGRNALNFFMPFNDDFSINANILREKINSIRGQKLQKAFAALVTSYAEKLTKTELDYLENLALKAEYFFSLGIPVEDFNKAQDFQLNGLVVLVDTNIIYSLLGLHSHRQNENCNQITSLITNQKLDCRLVFIRKTLGELQNAKRDFENHISKDDLTTNQIKSLLDSDSLNSFSKVYFEKKLTDPDTPHPADKIQYSQKILTSKKVQVYNHKFPHLEEEAFINSKFEDYYDFINIKNEARVKQGLPEVKLKDDKKLEHDIYLREAIISLRKDKNKINDLNFICLTLDKGLIDFDRFANSKKGMGKDDIAPNFVLPSIFLRKIRPFIPMVTDDYKKAFITSITSNTIDSSLPMYSDAVQRSMSYFKKLGIDDQDLITSIIKQELFFKEFIQSEEEDKQEIFIRSEIDKAYEKIKAEKLQVESELGNLEKSKKEESKKNDEIKKNLKDTNQSLEKEKVVLTEEIKDNESELLKLQEAKSLDGIEAKKKLFLSIEDSVSILYKQKIPIEKEAEKAYDNFIFRCSLGALLYVLLLIVLIYNIGWDEMEPYTYISGIILICVSYLYTAIKAKDFSPSKYFKEKRNKFLIDKYSDFAFDIEKYDELKGKKATILLDLSILKKEHLDTFGKEV
jgi:hypothetical protein